MKDKLEIIAIYIGAIAASLVITGVIWGACSSIAFLLQPSDKFWISAIARQGYSNIELQETPWIESTWNCGSTFAKRFKASIGDKEVNATACSGAAKGVTIRS